MMKKYFVVNDQNEEYVRRLLLRLRERFEDSNFDLIKEDEIDEERECIWLSEEKTVDKNKVYMYQKVSDIRKEIMEKFSEKEVIAGVSKSKICVLFSPMGNPYQRVLLKKEALSKNDESSLLVMDVGYFSGNGEEKISMSDFCFMIHKGSDNLIDRELIEEGIDSSEGYDEMRGFISPIHVTSLGQELNEFIKLVAARSGYDKILLSLNTLPPHFDGILKMADEITLFSIEDSVLEEYKEMCREGFKQYLQDIGVTGINNKLKEKRIICRISEN